MYIIRRYFPSGSSGNRFNSNHVTVLEINFENKNHFRMCATTKAIKQYWFLYTHTKQWIYYVFEKWLFLKPLSFLIIKTSIWILTMKIEKVYAKTQEMSNMYISLMMQSSKWHAYPISCLSLIIVLKKLANEFAYV